MLLAMRKSSRAFDDRFCLKSPTAVALFRKRADLDADLDTLKGRLEKRFYALYEHHYDHVEKRKAILRVKRDVQKERKPHRQSMDVLVSEGLDDVLRYKEVLVARNTLFTRGEAAVLRETDHAIRQLGRDALFSQALSYSSPELARNWFKSRGKNRKRLADKLSRSLYAYTAKWVSKANPLNYFAGLCIHENVPGAVAGNEPSVEFQIDVGYLLSLEKFLLQTRPIADTYGLMICPCLVDGNQIVFIMGEAGAVRLLAIADNPVLAAIRSFFQAGRGENLGQLVRCVLDRLDCGEATVRAYVQLLLREGILKLFLIDDFLSFDKSLNARVPQARPLFKDLGAFHGRTFSLGSHELSKVVEHLQPDVLRLAGIKHPVHLNLYFPMNSPPALRQKLTPVVEDLRRLKPLLTSYHCFTQRSRVLREALVSVLKGGKAEYTACLVHLVRNQPLIQKLDEQIDDVHNLESLSLLDGVLTGARVRELVEQYSCRRPDVKLDCNGVLDHRTGQYAITNLWDGGGHYLGRYRPRECPRKKVVQPADRHLVQIYDVIGTNKNLVGAVSDFGFGLDRRYRGLFNHWLEPGDILLEREDDQICYRNARTGKPIEFFWRGFVLIKGLPVPYQLLLLNSADAYYNPFGYAVPRADARFRPALRFGKIILRRGFWRFATREFPYRLPKESLLHFTYRFGRFIEEQTRETTNYFFYRLPREKEGHKPYFLDKTNCQSVAYLLHLLEKQSQDDRIILEVMRPAPEGLYRDRGKPHMAEILLEV